MKSIYEASNTIEAHMILNLVEQAGLRGRVDGEYLQGGVGELQANGIVRVMVDEADYLEAKKIVEEWDSYQTSTETEQEKNSSSPVTAGFVGFLLGLATLTFYYNSPVTDEGIDYNGDGQYEEKWKYKNGRASSAEVDRNFDGRIDTIYNYDRKGLIVSSASDENLDGIFETQMEYKYGQPIYQESDTTGDGFNNLRAIYTQGRLSQLKFYDPSTQQPVKIQRFGFFNMQSAEVDTNRDGKLDTIYEYDAIEEVQSKSNKARQ